MFFRFIGLLVTVPNILLAQCPVPDFDISSVACKNQNLLPENLSTGASGYEWDFCSGDFAATPQVESALNSTLLFRTREIRIVKEQAFWYGFTIDQASSPNRLIRFEFGTSLSNSPSIFDMGNPSNSLSSVFDFRMVKSDNIWYALIANTGENNILRFTFNNGLSSSPAVQNLGSFGLLDSPNGIATVVHESKLFAFVTNGNASEIVRLNFGSSVQNIPSAEKFSVSGGSTLRGISIVKECNRWFGLVTSYSNGKILWLDFSNGIASAPQSGEVNFFTSLSFPASVSITEDGGNFYAFIQSAVGPLYRLSFGESIVDKTGTGSDLGNFGISNENFAQEWVRDGSTWFGFSIDLSNRRLMRYTLPGSCGANVPVSTLQNPQVHFSESGTKEITLRATDAEGNAKYFRRTVTISNDESPDISFTYQNLCANHDVNFNSSNSSANVISYDWSFGDLSSASTEPSPTHQYNSAGDFDVSLEVTGSNACKNRLTKTIRIYSPPTASFTLPPGLLCTNNEFTFANTTSDAYGGNLAYQWYIENNSVATTRDLKYSFESIGVKTIKLVTSIPGCTSEQIQTTSELKAGPAIDFTFIGNCENAPVQFTKLINEPVTDLIWGFPNGVSSSEDNPLFDFDTAGEFEVTLSALSSSGCNNLKTKTVKVFSAPTPNFSIEAPPQSCSGSTTPFQNTTPDLTDSNITSWRWNFGDINSASNISELESPTHTFANAGSYTVELKAKTDKECESTFQKQVIIAQSPTPDFSNTSTCKEVPTTFTSAGADIKTYYWEIGTSYYLNKSVNHTFNTAGEHNVKLTVTGTNNCNSVKTKKINVPAPLNPSFSVWKNCVGFEAEFTDNTSGADPVIWRQWSIDGIVKENEQQTRFAITEFDILPTTLTVKSEAGCIYSKHMNVNVFQAPVAEFNVTPLSGAVPLEVSVKNYSESATKYKWTFFDATTTTSEEFEPAFTFNQVGEHAIELKASNQVGCESVMSKTIIAENPAADVEIKVMTVQQNPDKTLKVIVTLQNNGNTVLRNLPVSIDISGIFSFKEIIEDPIKPKEQYNLVLSYGITKSQDLNFLCAQTELTSDLVYEGNKACAQFEKTILLLSPYPNPVNEVLNIEWIGKVDRRVNVLITDSFGKAILQKDIESVDGFNHQFFDVTGLKEGLYFLVINDGATQKTQRIIISRKN